VLILNAIATSHLVWRNFAIRLGIRKDQVTAKKNSWRKGRKSKWKKGTVSTYQVHAVALNTDNKVSNSSSVCFDADFVMSICNNSTNVHVCNTTSCFVGEIQMDKSLQVATIGDKQNTSAGIGTVSLKGKGNAGVSHMFKIRVILYFPEFPVKILSVTNFSNQLDDNQGIRINTKTITLFFIGRIINITIIFTILLPTFQIQFIFQASRNQCLPYQTTLSLQCQPC
jgi:hypothetical protein